ncbi:hypothetical protein TSUD_313950 [Trifolium subterraneum]|uniref:Uncharacterized protein n=1 Tax=Trifolium subterraneum TaxID=3900 RepID=A0A2Z6MAG4_TRISU|nr:hypothetical protein TSUD_313950 [Trifolium subterraneum]
MKRKIARAKKPRAIIKRNAMNQLRCQIGSSESEWIEDSLYMIRVDPVCCGCCWEEEEEEGCFLRESPWCDPEEATVVYVANSDALWFMVLEFNSFLHANVMNQFYVP